MASELGSSATNNLPPQESQEPVGTTGSGASASQAVSASASTPKNNESGVKTDCPTAADSGKVLSPEEKPENELYPEEEEVLEGDWMRPHVSFIC